MASPDPNFEAKAKDILGLYLHPPENTAVFCVDAGGSRFRSLWISSSQREAEARTAMTSEAIRTMLFGPVPLSGLIAIWNGRDDGVWASCEDLFQTLAEKILEAGEPLLAYDVANEGIAHFPKSTRLRQLLGLALARSGASDAAKVILEELYGEGHRDEETIGLLARTYKDLAEAACAAPSRTLYLKRAQEFYAKAYQLTAGYWSGVNAAALAAVLGEQEEAARLAVAVREQCLGELEHLTRTGKDAYWVLATLGEAALILGQTSEAEERYAQAAQAGAKRYGALHSSRRNARLLMAHLGADPQRIEACFHVPAVVVFTGHMMDRPERRMPRFPERLEKEVSRAIRRQLEKLDAGFAYSSAACGSDILFLEAMLERNGETHIVLPYEKGQFAEDSIEGNPGWKERFEKVMERAADLVVASGKRTNHLGMLYEYANRVLYGLAAARANQLDTRLEGLAVWDGRRGDGPGGTASAVELWRNAGAKVTIVNLAELLGTEQAPAEIQVSEKTGTNAADAGTDFTPEIRALLFADAVGFSKLEEAEVPLFVEHFLGLVGKLSNETEPAPLMKNTWGDGLYFVFPDVRSAGRFALELRDRVRATAWEAKGLRDLDLRIGLHAGPIYACTDPVTGRRNYVGAHVSRAARIEPITPPGHVYASQSFAALAAAEPHLEFRCDYVGQTAMAKHYGTFPTYVVRSCGG